MALDVSGPSAPEVGELAPPTSVDEPLYEIVNGQRVELPPMGAYSTLVAAELHGHLWLHVREKSLGRSIPEMLFILDRERNLRRRPDVAFVSAERWPLDRPVPLTGDWDVIPDLAVEVVSPHDTAQELLNKVEEFFTHGVRRVWVIYPEQRRAYDYASPTQLRGLTDTEELNGGEILPGLHIALSKLFPPPMPGTSSVAEGLDSEAAR
ncbi:MAG: Uma2 family endonuclease [Planctomycetes bacterium]|nr:Uma2 family endonuclease [Planctomycetota bacterium]